jgi:GTP-binding protein HflX
MNKYLISTNGKHPKTRKAILVGAVLPANGAVTLASSLEELEGLATTAGYEPAGVITQRLLRINPKTFLGEGKVEELGQVVKLHDAEVVIFDEDLSPGQTRNLEKELGCRIIDRSWLILEIFNEHAHTREAKTQVELARLKYALPRLTRMWGHLSRQRGGIGLKDVGETQIQLDRRLIRDQISKLEKKLKQIDREKKTQRKSRRNIYKVALVGYTNVGKSSLMNCMTGAGTLVEDKLFATLDATVRKIERNFPFPILLADTVGLINKLPHDLVASFKSTLDEVRDADLLLKVEDLSHPDHASHAETTDRLLRELGADRLDSVRVFNKIDRVTDRGIREEAKRRYPDAVWLSCKTGEGLEALRKAIVACYEKRLGGYRLELDFQQARLVPKIRKLAFVTREDYGGENIVLHLKAPPGGKEKIEALLAAFAASPDEPLPLSGGPGHARP